MKTTKPVHKPKLRRNRREVTFEILRSKYEIFAETAEELTHRTKQPVSTQDVMALFLERQCDPNDLADIYCWTKLKWSHEQIDEFSDHALGRPRVRRRWRKTMG